MATGGAKPAPLYVIVGHLTRDRIGHEERCGGTALYAGVTAMRLGCRVGIVTSIDEEFQIPASLQRAEVTGRGNGPATTFELQETANGRVLHLRARAKQIGWERVFAQYPFPDLLHLAPVANEVSPDVPAQFPQAFVGATPQGWLRTTELGLVRAVPEALNWLPLERFHALVLSIEDVQGDLAVVRQAAASTPVLALTYGAAGCTLYQDGVPEEIPAFPASEVDPTGAGDVFAAAFFIALREQREPRRAARFAACAAAISVEARGTDAIPTRATVEERLRTGASA